jgi:hypothetical protein
MVSFSTSEKISSIAFCNSLVPVLPVGYGEINLNCCKAQLEPLPYLR